MMRAGSLASSLLAGAALFACAQIAGIEGPTERAEAGANGEPGGDGADIEILPDALSFGTVDCGVESQGKTLTIHNKGASKQPYRIVVPEGVPYRLAGTLEGELAPNGVATVNVFVKPAFAGDTTAPVVVTAGAAFKNVNVNVTGGGAQLSFAPTIADLGDVRKESGGSSVVELKNDGTKPVFLTRVDGAANGLSIEWQPAGPLKIEPGKSAPLTVKLAPGPEDAAAVTTKFVPFFDGAVCGAPLSLAASGRRMSYDVTIGSGDFGKIACNTAAPASKEIVISNYSSKTLTWTTAPPAQFTIVSGAIGSIPAGTSNTPTTGTIVVAPKPIGQTIGNVSEDLSITIDGIAPPSGGLRKTTLRYDVRGAIITVSPTLLGGFRDPWGWYSYDTKSFTVSNTGNESIALDWTFERTAGDSAWVQAPPSSVNAGASQRGQMSFNAQGSCPCEAKLTPTRKNQSGNAELCSGQTITFQGSN